MKIQNNTDLIINESIIQQLKEECDQILKTKTILLEFNNGSLIKYAESIRDVINPLFASAHYQKLAIEALDSVFIMKKVQQLVLEDQNES